MPSIKKRVTGFIRQISGPSQSEVRAPVSPPPQYEKCFIQRYLAGESRPKQPDIHYAKTGHSLPSHQLGYLHPEVFSAYTGPDGGITCILRNPPEPLDKSSSSSEVDYIDLDDGRMSRNLSRRASVAADMVETFEKGVRCHINPDPGGIRVPKSPVYIDNTVMTIRVMDRVYRVDDSNKRLSATCSSERSQSSVNRGSVSSGPDSLTSNRGSISSARGSMSSTSEDEPYSPLYKTSDIIDIDDQLDLIETEDGYLPVKSIQPSEISPNSKRVTISSPVKPVPRPNFLNLAVAEPLQSSQSEETHPVKQSPLKSEQSSSMSNSFDQSCRISLDAATQKAKLPTESTSAENGVKNSNTDENRSSQNKETVKMNNDYPELKSNQMEGGGTPDAVMIEQTENILNKLRIDLKDDISISRAGVRHWNRPNCSSFGISDSLYERNPVSGEQAGSPIADTFAVVARKNSALLVLGDGVNWGARAALASRAAVHGAMDYLNTALFGVNRTRKLSTQDVFQILLRSFHAAHCLIIEEDAMLTTLTAAVVLPTENDRFHFCVCNVGDSLAYVYSKGEVREVTQGSHDITANRDMRDALGALGPVDGLNPELSNLTCSITEVLPGDIVFLTSDGISDNFDPVVGKFCVPKKPERTSSQKMGANFPRSRKSSEADALPTVEGFQRHELTLLRIEDILNHDWGSNSVLNAGSGRVVSAAELCQRMFDFCQRLTTAKRKILEDPELYPENDSDMQDQKIRRRRVCEKLALVPGKLDHATIAAYQVGDRIQELQDFRGDLTETVGRTTPGLVLSAPHASCEDLTMRDSPDDDDVTPTPSISLDSTPLASGASSLAATPTHTPRI